MIKKNLSDLIVEGKDYKALKEIDKAASREVSVIMLISLCALAIIVGGCELIQWTWTTAGMTEDWPGINDAPMVILAIMTFMLGTLMGYATITGKVRTTLNHMCNDAFGYTPNNGEEADTEPVAPTEEQTASEENKDED